MIPILYEKNETAFSSNGICRLRDCLSCVVTEERNGIYECDFEYPVTGAHYNEIVCGRIIAVTHDDSGDVQPFDIVGYTAPINGVVSFHAVHISYRLNTVAGINTQVTGAHNAQFFLTRFQNFCAAAGPGKQFTFTTNISTTAYCALFAQRNMPYIVRQWMGGTEGSVLDTFHGEWKFDRFQVALLSARGVQRDFQIRYGLNMTEYNDEVDFSGSANSFISFWKGDNYAINSGTVADVLPSYSGRKDYTVYDLTDMFETEPTSAQLETAGRRKMNSEHANNPAETINVSFVRLQDSEEYEQYQLLMQCGLCDTVLVKFPMYGMSARMKIVKVVWNVLQERYDSMELGTLATTLSQALGVSGGSSYSGSSGGGGGTTNYNDLTNKPQIGGVTLTGNKTASDLGLVADSVTTISPTITASTGTLVSCTAFKFGKMVFMTIAVRKTSSTASGANIFTGTISETAYRPKAIVTGASYYDAHAISAQINTSGAIVFRNASPTAVTIGSSYSVAVSFTYMID